MRSMAAFNSTCRAGRVHQPFRHQQHTAWPAECRPPLCSASCAERVGGRSVNGRMWSPSSNSGSSMHGPSSTSSRSSSITRLRVLSSKVEPSSISSSFEEAAAPPSGSAAGGRSSSSSSSNPADADDFGYMQEYAALKQQLLDNTRKGGGAVGAYLLLTVNGTAALLAMVGAAASYAYLSLLCRDVDAVAPTDTVPMWEANKIDNLLLRRAAKLRAAYQKALRPRLLVPVGLGLLLGAYNRLADEPLPLLYSGSLLLGFLSYKLALVTKLVSDLAPKSFRGEAERPKVEQIEDELDQWGRPKKRAANPIDAMPEDMQAKAYEQLEEQLAKEERRLQD